MTQPTTRKPFTVAAMRHGGTHLITPVVRRLTDRPVYSPKGQASLNCIPSDIVIIFPRDPRNRVVSNLRYKMGDAAKGLDAPGRDAALAEFLGSRKTPDALRPIEFMTRWADKWRALTVGGAVRAALTVRFEELAGDNSLAEVTRIAEFLARAGAKLVATPSEAKAYALGRSGTFTGSHSNYIEWFGPQSTRYWRSNFGPQCTHRMGYQIDEVIGV
jgi:hypothetical protein